MRRIESLGSARIVSLDARVLREELRKKAARLAGQRDEVEAVYLIGSLARGDHTGFSDADILIILRESELDPIERIKTYLPFFGLPVGVDLLVYTEDEFDEIRKQGNPQIEKMIRERQQLA